MIESIEKLTPAQSSALILTYLRQKESRPYSAIDISANLKNRVTKTSAAKILKDLHERGEIAGCTQGKQSVYHALQVKPHLFPLQFFPVVLLKRHYLKKRSS
jgi:26S proteasome regulatory subunit (ATPase 3-interacting protein)